MTEPDAFLLDPSSGNSQPLLAPTQLTGQKAAGLLRIPLEWQPPFFILTSQLISAFRDCIDHPGVNPEEALGQELVSRILSLSTRIARPGNHIILRSSSAAEGLDQRGAFESIPCEATWSSISQCLRDITLGLSLDATSPPFAIIVQKLLNLKRASGHLSNERRISTRKTTWLWELDSIAGIGAASFKRFSSIGTPPLEQATDIQCFSFDHLVHLLRGLAAWASTQEERLHFEWIWDGEHLWIVQADRAPEIRGEAPALAFKDLPKPQPIPSLRTLERVVDTIDEGWQKLESTNTFKKCGLPTPDIWILRDPAILSLLHQGQVPRDFTHDLEVLLHSPIVIRTDLRRSSQGGEYLLPRTETITSAEDAKAFLIATTRRFDIVALDRLAFFLHRFIPARSSAYAMADPTTPRVRVDGLWGLPDGLLYYPHDSFELSAEIGSKIQKRVRFKDEYLDPTEDGRWAPRKAGAPWDWKSSLEDSELYAIADATHRLAKELNSPVQVMWFVGIPFQTGHPSCLPWYYGTEEPPHGLYSRKASLLKDDSLIIRRPDDLRELRQQIENGESITLITARPIPDFLRDQSFLAAIAELAKRADAFVELEGSVLSHAYYILRRHGVSVLVKDPFLANEDRKTFDKLVRDRVPDKIASHGETAITVRLSPNALGRALKSKILEEALELFWAEGEASIKEELVDLYTVVEACARHEGFSENEIAQAAEDKKRTRGGFDEGVVLRGTIESPLIPTTAPPSLFKAETSGPESSFIEETSASVEELANAPRMEGPNLALPLIPPNPERRYLSYAFQPAGLGITINIRYREKEIVIELSPGPRRREQEAPQLPLFDNQ